MSLGSSPIAVGNEEVSILKSEVDELEKFLSNLVHQHSSPKNNKFCQSSLQSPPFTAKEPESEYTDYYANMNNVSTSIEYTVVDGGDPGILNVIAFEEVVDSESLVKSIGVQWDLNDINCDASDEISSLNTCLNLSPTALSNQSNTNLLSKSDNSLDTISSAETLCRPNTEQLLHGKLNINPDEIMPCPYSKLDGSPFHLFNLESIVNATSGYKHFENRAVAYYGTQPYSYSSVTHNPRPFEDNPYLLKVLSYIDIVLPDFSYNSAMIHWYKDNESHMPHHSDNEECIEKDSDIVSISLGDSRVMEFVNKYDETVSHSVVSHGDVVIMSRKSQDYYTHAIPSVGDSPQQGRLSITLRLLKEVGHEKPSETLSTVTNFLADLDPFDDHLSNENAAGSHEAQVGYPQNNPILPTSDGYQVPQSHNPTATRYPSQHEAPTTMNRRQSQWAPSFRETRQVESKPQYRKPYHHIRPNSTNMKQSTWQPITTSLEQFPQTQLHPSRRAVTGNRDNNIKEDVIFISSSMFRDLNPAKLTSTSINAHVFFYPGATARQMQARLSADQDFQNLSKRTPVSKIFLLTATNNVDLVCSQKQQFSDVMSEISELVNYICGLFSGTEINLINILPRASRERSDIIRNLNDLIDSLCKKHYSRLLKFVDTYSRFHLFSYKNGQRKQDYFKSTHHNDFDNVHLNSSGITKLGAHLKHIAHL